MSVIRWLLVLPAAVLAHIAGCLIAEILEKIILPFLALQSGLNPVFAFLFNPKFAWIPNMWLAHGLCIFAGAKMAPRKRYFVSLILAIVDSSLLIFMTGYFVALPPWERPGAFNPDYPEMERTVPLMIFTNLSTMAILAMICYFFWQERELFKDSSDPDK